MALLLCWRIPLIGRARRSVGNMRLNPIHHIHIGTLVSSIHSEGHSFHMTIPRSRICTVLTDDLNEAVSPLLDAQNDKEKDILVGACNPRCHLGFIYAAYPTDQRPAPPTPAFVVCLLIISDFDSITYHLFGVCCPSTASSVGSRLQYITAFSHLVPPSMADIYRYDAILFPSDGTTTWLTKTLSWTTFRRAASQYRQTYDQVCREYWFRNWHWIHQLEQSSTLLVTPRHLWKFDVPGPPSGGTHGLCISRSWHPITALMMNWLLDCW